MGGDSLAVARHPTSRSLQGDLTNFLPWPTSPRTMLGMAAVEPPGVRVGDRASKTPRLSRVLRWQMCGNMSKG